MTTAQEPKIATLTLNVEGMTCATCVFHVEKALKGVGIDCPYAAMQSNGGTTSFAWAKEHPITLMESGPAAGCNGAAIVGELCGEARVI